MENFFLNGYEHYRGINFIDKKIIEEIQVKSVEFCFDENEETWKPKKFDNYFMEIKNRIESCFLKPVFKSFKFLDYAIWEGVDDYSQFWHNDCIDKNSLNTNFLFYFDNCTEETRGAISIRSENSIHRIYPSDGDLIWLNQTTKFQHKAERSVTQRRVVGFDFRIFDLS